MYLKSCTSQYVSIDIQFPGATHLNLNYIHNTYFFMWLPLYIALYLQLKNKDFESVSLKQNIVIKIAM
jgi:hypothetical protein